MERPYMDLDIKLENMALAAIVFPVELSFLRRQPSVIICGWLSYSETSRLFATGRSVLPH